MLSDNLEELEAALGRSNMKPDHPAVTAAPPPARRNFRLNFHPFSFRSQHSKFKISNWIYKVQQKHTFQKRKRLRRLLFSKIVEKEVQDRDKKIHKKIIEISMKFIDFHENLY